MGSSSKAVEGGFFITKKLAICCAAIFVISLVAVGLMVHFLPQTPEDDAVMPPEVTTSSATTADPLITTEAPIIDVRLSGSLIPRHYVVYLRPYLSGNFSIDGYVEIHMECINQTNEVAIHMADIITHNDTIKLSHSEAMEEDIDIISHAYDNQREFYIATLVEQLTPGTNYIIKINFTGLLNDQLRGFYRSVYTNEAQEEIWVATTQFQPTDARRAFPCFDEPALKATFDISLGRQENMTAISNMPINSSIDMSDEEGWYWDHFERSVPMSTYLVAFVISDFVSLNSTEDPNTLYRVWARPSAIEQAEYSLDIGRRMLNFFEGYYNISFPLPKQDMIALPDFAAGAMENWGLITYRETAMLYEEGVSSASNKQRVAVVVSHELAHQWFGDLVTPEWWTDLWLNEGFASYMEYLGVASVESDWQMMEQFVTGDLHYVFAIDCLESSHPISIPVEHPDQINEIFDSISYSKGASIIRMMAHFLSEETFKAGLTNYLTAMAYKAASQDDLWEFLTEQAEKDSSLEDGLTVKEVMDTWTLQMGYPVINVERSEDGTTATVSQKRFLLIEDSNSTEDHDYKWWVPLSFTTQDGSDFITTKNQKWLRKTESSIPMTDLPKSDKWVLFNIQETGYYRVNYDHHNWQLLIDQLKDDHLKVHILNRAQLIDDALSLARAGQLSYDIALGVIGYLNKEEEYVPWNSAFRNFGYLESMFSKTSGFGSIKAYLLSLVVPLYESVGFEDDLTDSHLAQFKRVQAVGWACSLGYQPCVDSAVDAFNQYMKSPVARSSGTQNSLISPNLRLSVYCTAIAAGGETEWDFLWQEYLISNVATEKSTILSALGCSKETWILSRYLDMAFTEDSGIRKQDAATVYSSIANNDIGGYLAWRYLRGNWVEITQYYGSGLFAISNIITAATSSFTTELELSELEQFKTDNAETLGTASRSIDQAIELTQNNIEWKKQNYKVIEDWIEDNASRRAVCVLQPSNPDTQNITGTIEITQSGPDEPVLIEGTIEVYTELDVSGLHGFHIHESGVPNGDCVKALGHYNPFEKDHGAPDAENRHVGDLGNIAMTKVEDGRFKSVIEITDSLVTLFGDHSVVSRGIVLHEGVDDLGQGENEGSLTTGNAGARIACCTITV